MLPSRGSAGDAAVEAGGGGARALRGEHPEVLRRGQGGRVVPTVAARKGCFVLYLENLFIVLSVKIPRYIANQYQ